MMKVFILANGDVVFRDEEFLSDCESWKVRTNTSLSDLSQVLKERGFPTTEKYLRGCAFRGAKFIQDETERDFLEAIKKIPFAVGSKERLVKEKLAEIPQDILFLADQVKESIQPPTKYGSRMFALVDGDIEFSSGTLQVSDKFTKRMEESHTRGVSDSELELEKDLLSIISVIRKWDDLGVNMMPALAMNLDGSPLLLPGILGKLVGDRFSDKRPKLSREALLMEICNNVGETKEARKIRLGE